MNAVRAAIRVSELMLLYGVVQMLGAIASPLHLALTIFYLYVGLSLIVAVEWTLLPVLSLMH